MGKVKRDAVTLEFSQADLGEGIAEAILVKAPTRGAGGAALWVGCEASVG